MDVPSLQKHLENIAYSDVRLDDVRNMSDDDFVQVFKMTQLMLQYVIHGQETLYRANEEHQRRYAQAEHKVRLMSEQNRQRVTAPLHRSKS